MNIDKSPEKIKKMFNSIAKNYDKMNDIISFKTQKIIKKACVNLIDIEHSVQILDLCTGTGDTARIIKSKFSAANVIGVDFSDEMLKIAVQKAPDIDFINADAINLPFSDNYFDIITETFGLRNIKNQTKAIKEIYRVLKPGGQLMHLDFGKKNSAGTIFEMIVSIFAECFSQNAEAYKYLIKSKQEFPEPDELSKEFLKTGFTLKQQKDFLFKAISCQIYIK